MFRFQPKTNSSKARAWASPLAKCRAARQRGFSIVEVTVILLTAAILSSVLVASVSSTLNSGRTTRANADVANIYLAYSKFNTDTTLTGFNVNGTEVDLLVSEGDIPELASPAPVNGANWLQAVNNSSVDTMARHLATNNPGGAFTYAVPPSINGWRGAYLAAPVESDPWGNRYAINSEYYDEVGTSDTIVISAGPNETIETDFTGSPAITAGGDDIILVF